MQVIPHLAPPGRPDLSAAVNWTLFVLVLIVVLAFRSTDNLAAAYGLAVTGAMCIDTVLFAVVAYGLWKWHKLAAAVAVAVFAMSTFRCWPRP